MIKNITNKRAQLTQTTLITIIILILSAAIILFFFKTLYLDTQIDREACRASVEIRDNLILRGEGFAPEMAPLKCKTEEITISKDNPDLIKKDIANAMYNCWWMMGEGKRTPFAESSYRAFQLPGKGNAQTVCVICSTIKFSENLQKKNLQLNIGEYMANTKVPLKNMTYLQYFIDDPTEDLKNIAEISPLSTNKDYTIIFMGVRGKEFWDVLTADAVAVGLIGAGTFVLPGGTQILSKLGQVVIKNPYVAAIVISGALLTQGASTAYSNHYVATKCDGNWEGCYQVILGPLTAEEISQNCQNVESIP